MKNRATVVCWRDGKILLVARKHARWALPGGTIRADESPVEAAARELQEETALDGYPMHYAFRFSGFRKHHFVFFVLLPREVLAVARHEIARCRWVRPARVMQLAMGVPTREIIGLLEDDTQKRPACAERRNAGPEKDRATGVQCAAIAQVFPERSRGTW